MIKKAACNRIDLTGRKFGRLTVLEYAETRGKTIYWLCQCECGNKKLVQGNLLKNGQTTSCSCHRKETCSKTGKAAKTHGMSETPTYNSWECMRARCYNPHNASFKYYGGAGITVCDRWKNSFENFLADMGERPEGTTIDRIDAGGNYEPSNCRWADAKTQALNKNWGRRREKKRAAV